MSNHPVRDRIMAALERQDGRFLHVGGIAHDAQCSVASVRKVLADLYKQGLLEISRARTAPVSGDGRRTGSPGYRLRRTEPVEDRFLAELRAVAAGAPLDEALAGLYRIAQATGIFAETCHAKSIAEVCDMLAMWCTEQRTAVERLRGLVVSGSVTYSPGSGGGAGTSGTGQLTGGGGASG
jgi:hypothetical protein